MMDDFSIAGQEQRANSIAFNNDGTRMIVAGVGNIHIVFMNIH